MNDPLSPFNAPPPRYLLESDSSDEEGQGVYVASGSRPRRPPGRPSISISITVAPIGGSADAADVGEAFLGVGQAGKYLLRRTVAALALEHPDPQVVISSDSTVIGRGYRVGGTLVLSVEGTGTVDDGALHALARKLLEAFPSAGWTVLSIYVPAMYIPAAGRSEARRASPPIRYVSISRGEAYEAAGAGPYASPNYTTGLPGALLALSAHPSSPCKHPLSALLLPLPLSSLSPADLGAALSVTTRSLSLRTDARARWTEDDDEPYAAPGMGGGRAMHVDRSELSSMYT